MRDVLPSTSMLLVFDATMTHGGFARAADHLNLSAASVSYTIKSLEALLGVRLFDRHPDGVTPTDDARTLINDARDALDRVRAFRDKGISAGTGERLVRILASQAFATLWLMPRMGELIESFPECRFELINWVGGKGHNHDSDVPGVDFEIRWMRTDDAAGSADQAVIVNDYAMAVCSPRYLARIGGRLTAETVSKATIIHALNWPEIWRKWSVSAFGAALSAAHDVRLQHTALCTQAAESDIGVAIVHGPLTLRELDSGALVVANDCVLPVPEGYVAIRHRPLQGGMFGTFVEWVRSNMALKSSVPGDIRVSG